LRTFDLGGVNVGTIEDYQAVERRDVIVLSLTRSNATFVPNDVWSIARMGVFQQPKRTNVATTRGEKLFIVSGTQPSWLMMPFGDSGFGSFSEMDVGTEKMVVKT
jgi:superfamily I DNA and/or RNA helicase